MRKYISILCVAICLLMLFSCDFGRDTGNDVYYGGSCEVFAGYNFKESYEASANVFTGTLIDYELSETYDGLRDRQVNITVKIDGVYKGDYSVGEIVNEDYNGDVFYYMAYFNYDYEIYMGDTSKDPENILEKNERYMFMTGIDPKTDDKEFAEKVINDCSYHALKILDGGRCAYVAGSLYAETNYNNLLVFAFDLKKMESHFYVAYFTREEFDRYYPYGLKDAYDISDDVYFGEVLESEEIGVAPDNPYQTIYKIKVKVMAVFKGDNKPGTVIEDLCILSYTDGFVSNTNFILTGEAFNAGYTLETETAG